MEKEAAMEKTEGEANKPAAAATGAGRPRTRLVRVDQKIIDFMMRQPPARPFPVFSDEVLDRLGMPGFRALMERAAAAVKRVDDRNADILHQYRTKGYAEVEETLSDEEEEEEEEEVAAMLIQEKKKKEKKMKKTKEEVAAMPVEKKKKKKKEEEEKEVRNRPTTTS